MGPTRSIWAESFSTPGVNAGELRWTVEYKPNEIGHKEAYIEDTLPAGIDLRTDATGRLILDDNITVTELTLNANGNYTDGDPMKSEDLEKAISYDHGTRVLRFDIPESSKAYRLTYKTDITGDPGTTLANKVALSSSTTTQGGVEKGYTIADADASATMQRSGSLEIKKQDGSKEPEPLEDAEFTLYTEDGKTEFRKGKTGEDGILTLRGLPEGSYILKETKAPDGYNLVDRTYEVVVVKMANGKLSTSIDGKTEPDSNKITVTNIKTDTVGNLAIRKTLSGNATDTKKEFTFTVTIFTVDGEEIYGLSEEEFAYIGTGGKADGTLALDEDGKATFTLKGGESITILNLPKDFSYTVVEEDYRGDGYTTTFTNADGTIEADKVTEVIFTNTRNRPDTPDPEPTPKPTPKPTPTPKPAKSYLPLS